MKKLLLLGMFLLLPSLALGAGFAKDSLFLSKSPVQEGDSVRIYAIVANEGTSAFVGSVVITDGSQKVGSVPVSLDPGATQTAFLAWKPTAGSHTLSAQLTSNAGTVIEQESAIFSIAAKPKPIDPNAAATSSSALAAVESSDKIQKSISGVSPQAGQVVAPLFSFFDSLRSKAADLLDAQLENVKKNLSKTPSPGLVEGDSTSMGVPSTSGSIWSIPWTIYLYLLTVLRFLVGNPAAFYPILAAIFFYFLWRMYKRFRRPKWG